VTRPPGRLLLVVLALSLLTAGCGVFGGAEQRTLSARFERTVGLYESSDVRILGVKVGRVTAIEPDGDDVRVEMSYDAKYKVPADAKAVIFAPSVVSDRYVQLTPVYRGGAVLEDGAQLGQERTAVPVELDDIYDAFNEINLALGPKGANKDGALSDLVDVSANNLEGNGELLGSTLKDFSQGLTALSGSREELFATVANLADFTNTIARRDETVRTFNRDLADVAAQLEGEREDLAAATANLSVALGEVAAFVRENQEDLRGNVADLAEATRFLSTRTEQLEEFLTVSATALSNLQLAYNPDSGTLDTRDNNFATLEEDPTLLLCSILEAAGQPPEKCQEVKDALEGLPVPLPGGGDGQGAAASSGLGPAAAGPARRAAPAPAPRDMTLGGILDARR
jgi:phospholipid/cholesterol/gamma-HCH transport system substrate-binding protein